MIGKGRLFEEISCGVGICSIIIITVIYTHSHLDDYAA
jgi:hypothetical protein